MSYERVGRGTWAGSLLPLFLLIMLCVVFYFPSLSYFFGQDDFVHLYDAARTDLTDLHQVLQSHAHFFRPLSITVYFGVMYKIFGLLQLPYHIMNLAFFSVNVVLTYLFGKMIFRDNAKGFVVALLYASRGVHFDVVSWATLFQDPLMSFFVLLSLIFYVKYSRGRTQGLVLSMSAFVLACFSKEIAFMTPFIILAYEIFLNTSDDLRRRVVGISSFLLTLSLCAAVHIFYAAPVPSKGEYGVRLGFFVVPKLADYFMICVNILYLPFLMFPHYNRHSFLIFCCLLLILLCLFLLAAKRRGDRQEGGDTFVDEGRRIAKETTFGLAFFFLAAFPALFLKGRFEPYYMSLASLGVCITLVSLWGLLWNRRLSILAVICVVCISLFVNIQIRTRKLSHVGRFSPPAKTALEDLRPFLQEARPGTDVYIMECDRTLAVAIAWGDAIKLFYPSVRSVTFDFGPETSKPTDSEMKFRCSDGHLTRVQR
jgi:hypothetical protein